MEFPDAEAGVRELLNQFGKTYLELTIDYQDQGLPAFLVYRVGGNERGVFRDDRITVEVRGRGLTKTKEAAKEAKLFLTKEGGKETSVGLIDNIDLFEGPISVPQPDGNPSLVTTTYTVSTRGA